MPRGNDLEREALQLVLKAGENGILQSDMWKTLKVTSREGSRLAKKFVDKGAVERKKVLYEGRWTYKLYSLTKPVTIESILDCPCMVCEEIDKCFVGGQSSPLNCHPLNLWIRPDMAPIITESNSEP